MTSSATQTDEDGRPEADDEQEVAAQEGGSRAVARASERVDSVISGALLLGGWVLVLFINDWHLGAPAMALCLGWLAVLLCGRFFWNAALTAAADGVAEADGPGLSGWFDPPTTRGGDLELEKRALLKAIKEVEFDKEMGKMSDADAAEITRVYRARAIEILKETDGGSAGASLSLDQVIEREVRARLALAGVTATRKKARGQPVTAVLAEPVEAGSEVVTGSDEVAGSEVVAGSDEVAGSEVVSARDEARGADLSQSSDPALDADDAPSPADAREVP